MKVKTKQVYYCDFCKKKSMSSFSMKKHEAVCTLNPERRCGLCNRKGILRLTPNTQYTNDTLDYIYSQTTCPVCILAGIRFNFTKDQISKGIADGVFFDYKKMIDQYWKDERREEQENIVTNSLGTFHRA